MLKLGRKILSFRKRNRSHRRRSDDGDAVPAVHQRHGPPPAGEGTARSGPLGTRHGARDERLEQRPLRPRHPESAQQHPLHHHQSEPEGIALASHSRRDHQPSRPPAQEDQPAHRREYPDHDPILLGQRPQTHHILRPVPGCSRPSTGSPTSSSPSLRSSSCWVSSLSARPSRTSRTAYGSDWPKKRRTNWVPPPPRCWDGSNTCARSPSIRVPSKR